MWRDEWVPDALECGHWSHFGALDYSRCHDTSARVPVFGVRLRFTRARPSQGWGFLGRLLCSLVSVVGQSALCICCGQSFVFVGCMFALGRVSCPKGAYLCVRVCCGRPAFESVKSCWVCVCVCGVFGCFGWRLGFPGPPLLPVCRLSPLSSFSRFSPCLLPARVRAIDKPKGRYIGAWG